MTWKLVDEETHVTFSIDDLQRFSAACHHSGSLRYIIRDRTDKFESLDISVSDGIIRMRHVDERRGIILQESALPWQLVFDCLPLLYDVVKSYSELRKTTNRVDTEISGGVRP